MCGIFCLLNNRCGIDDEDIDKAFNKGQNRGPEQSELMRIPGFQITMGFHRLAINGISRHSGQPMTIDSCTLICNGEIYNYKELFKAIGVEPQTDSDCEIIIHLYKLYGIRHTLQLLDGVFAFVLYDCSDFNRDPVIHVARDPYGVRPLYMLLPADYSVRLSSCQGGNHINEWILGFASELKVLSHLLNSKGRLAYGVRSMRIDRTKEGFSNNQSCIPLTIKQFEPGTVTTYSREFKVNARWRIFDRLRVHTINSSHDLLASHTNERILASQRDICRYLNTAVKKRVVGTTDRPVACLLSGGLDSSLVTALVNKYYDGELETYSIGMQGSEDLRKAKIVADYLGTKHTEVVISPEEFFNAIPEVIRAIESYDTTTVRASVGNYLIGKHISQCSDAKVIFNGDGSDELTGGYIYFLKAPTSIEFDKECRRLLRKIYAFDVLRSDKSISSHGLEPRTPFLDKSFVDFYMGIPVSIRNPLSEENIRYCTSTPSGWRVPREKFLLRQAFHLFEPELLPQEILWRTKEAFSDGVSGDAGSWFEIIKEKVEQEGTRLHRDEHSLNTPLTTEQRYYRAIYDEAYPNTANIVPYFWMPKYVKTDDCSARTLDIYKTSPGPSTQES